MLGELFWRGPSLDQLSILPFEKFVAGINKQQQEALRKLGAN
jgi:hypothetical protein